MTEEVLILGLGFAIGIAWIASGTDVTAQRIHRLARRQHLQVSAVNAPVIIAYLATVRPWRVLGFLLGASASAALLRLDSFPLVTGWFGGVLLAEVQLARRRPRGAHSGLRLLSPAASLFWYGSAGIAVALVGAAVVVGVRPGERAWALAAVLVGSAVQVLLVRLHEQPDLAEEESAVKSRSAHVLASGGGLVTVWLAWRTGVLTNQAAAFAAGLPYMLVALIIGTRAWTVRSPGGNPLPARLFGTACAVATVVTVVVLPPAPPPGPALRITFGTQVDQPIAWRADYAYASKCVQRPGGSCSTWAVVSSDREAELYRADPEGPFAVSPRGTHVAYRDRESRRLVVHELATLTRHDLLGTTFPTFSPDGRHVASAGAGFVQILSLQSGADVRIPGVSRIIGLGPRTLVAATSPDQQQGVGDAGLVTFDLSGRKLTQVPFDPTLDAWLSPDGKRMVILNVGEQLVSMDPATGKVLGRVRLKLDETLTLLAWAGRDRILVRVGDDDLLLVDTASGKGKDPEEPLPATAVFGRVPA